MVSCKLYFVRHGETTANRDDILQGQCDFPLTDSGQLQMGKCGLQLKDVKFDFCLTSDLYRAVHSAAILCSNFVSSLNSEQTALLRETCFGLREGLPRSYSLEEASKIVAVQRGWDEARWKELDNGVESEEAIQQRILLALHFIHQRVCQYIASDYQSNNTAISQDQIVRVLIVSHGGFIKKILKLFTDPSIVLHSLHNGSISIVNMKLDMSKNISSSDDIKVFQKCISVNPLEINMVTL